MSNIESLKMLKIQWIICHEQVIRVLIKSNMGEKLDYVGINIILEKKLGHMRIISKEDSFGYTVLQLGFSFSGGSQIDTTSKAKKGGEVISLGCSFLDWISNCIGLWKVILKLDIMVQGI